MPYASNSFWSASRLGAEKAESEASGSENSIKIFAVGDAAEIAAAALFSWAICAAAPRAGR
jgi:hypothetical protein